VENPSDRLAEGEAGNNVHRCGPASGEGMVTVALMRFGIPKSRDPGQAGTYDPKSDDVNSERENFSNGASSTTVREPSSVGVDGARSVDDRRGDSIPCIASDASRDLASTGLCRATPCVLVTDPAPHWLSQAREHGCRMLT